MAQLIEPPGTPHGPCHCCRHPRCEDFRSIAQSTCHMCGDLIGYGRAYCFENWQDNRPVHVACLAAEEDQASQPRIMRLVYSRTEAALLLGIGESTLSDYQSRGEISYVKLGTRTLFRPEHITSFLEQNTVKLSRRLENAIRRQRFA